MKDNPNDRILARIIQLNNKSISKIKDNLKGTRPFASRPIPPEDLIYAKNTVGYEDMQDLVKEYGQEQLMRLLFDITVMENRRKRSGTIPKVQEQPPKPPIEISPPVEGFGQEALGRPVA